MLINKITNSLAYRLPVFYKYWLSKKIIKRPVVKQTGDATVLTMTGKQIISMTRLMLLSIASNWETLPRLIIVTDGSITAEGVKEELKFWLGEIVVNDWLITKKYHLEKGRQALINYAGKHVLGKKLAVILHYAALQTITWVDSDILFYNDFAKHIPPVNDFVCAGSEEPHSVYDERVMKHFNNDLYKLYTFSSGLLLVNGRDIYEKFDLEKLLDEVTDDYEHYFTEQTIFAHVCSTSLGIIWDMGIVKNFHNDNTRIAPMDITNVVARHYTMNVRHLFWRDAFFNLRFK